MFRALTRFIAAAAVMLMASVGLVALQSPQRADAALNGSMFDSGLIISDSVFYDFGTMTVDDIQRFLDSTVSVCKAKTNGPTCLRYYKMDTMAKPGEDGRCTALPAATNQSAAQIIFAVANACHINPRVLIVILQKEQGLIQAQSPTDYMYRAALGYGCPDSNPAICGKGSAVTGLFNQLYRAAGQLQWYGDPRGSFTFLKVGTNVSVKYQADSCDARNSAGTCTTWVNKCGSKTFQLKSQATAALYYYTPYTPNAAALTNLYGSGDACSAYGNRNFWRFYSDWFGSPIGGGFLLKSETSPTYLIVDDTKYEIDVESLTTALKPLGPLGTVSQAYLDSFKDGGVVTPLVRNAAKQLFLVAGGAKYSVANCNVALEMGLDCAKAVTLTTSQLNALPNAGVSTTYVPGDGADRYLIDNGEIHEILDSPSIAAANITLPTLSKAKVSAFKYLPFGAPIASNGTLFIDRVTNQQGVYLTGQFYRIDEQVAKEIDFTKWFTPSAGSLSPQGLSAVETGVTLKPFLTDSQSNRWLLSATGKRRVSTANPLVTGVPQVDAQLLERIPTSDTEFGSPALVQTPSQKGTFYVAGGVARQIYSNADKPAVSALAKQPNLISLLPTAFAQLTVGNPVLAPGALVKSKTTSDIFVVTDLTRMVHMPDLGAAAALGITEPPRKVDSAAFAGYNTKSSYSGVKFICNSDTYVAIGGQTTIVDPAAVSHLPGKAVSFNDDFCYNLTVSTNTLGRFIRVPSTKTYYLIESGKKRQIANYKAYLNLLGEQVPALDVDAAFAARFVTGLAAPSKMPTTKATSSNTAGATSGSSTQGTTTTGGTTPTTAKKYTVKSGDTLSWIATKFAVKLSTLMATNKITNANSIQIGQVLTIPKS